MYTLHHVKTPSKQSIVYSLAHHHKQPCLITAGSYGPVMVWKVKGWKELEELEEEKEEETVGVGN